jgi:hypothetical protein
MFGCGKFSVPRKIAFALGGASIPLPDTSAVRGSFYFVIFLPVTNTPFYGF